MKNIFISLLLTTILGLILAGSILPDNQNNMLGALNSFAASDLTFQFKLATKLNFNQFIAVRFPAKDQAGAALTWDFKTTAPTCTMYDSAGKAITLTGVKSGDTEKMIAYCQLTDVMTSELKAATTYRLSVNVPKASGAVFYPNFDLVTCTTNDMTKGLLIDSGMSFGNANAFVSYKSGSDLLTVKLLTKVDSAGKAVTTKTYAYETFNINMHMVVKSGMMGTASLIAFEYPDTKLVTTLPTSYTSTDYVDPAVTPALKVTPALNKALAGTFVAAQTSANCQVVSGIATSEEWLADKRNFNIIAKGLVAGDGVTTKQKLTVKVYYKNSMVIQSYHQIDFLQTTKATVTFKVTHPEEWDIYMSGAWPLKFSYKVSAAISKATYVRIQHSNMNAVANVWNFVASTCDFSMNTAGFEKGFGKRNNCFPLWQSLNYASLDYADNKIWKTSESSAAATVATTEKYLGSGIYFRQAAFVKDTEYFVQVWGVADVCGRNNKADPVTKTTSPATKVELLFKFDIFSKIDQTTEALFSDNDKVVAQKENATGAGNAPTCYSTFRGEVVSNESLGFEIYTTKASVSKMYQLATLKGKVVESVNCQVTNAVASGDKLFYKEVTDPVILKQTATATPPSSGYGFNLWNAAGSGQSATALGVGYGPRTSNQNAPAQYLYSATSANALIGTTNAILIRGDAATAKTTTTSTKNIHASVFPAAIFLNGESAANAAATDASKSLWGQQAGVLEIYFCKDYFALNAVPKCVVSWHHGLDFGNATNITNKKNVDITKNVAFGANQSFWMGPASGASSSTTLVVFPTDAEMASKKTARATQLRNTFIRAPSDATTTATGTTANASLLSASSVWPKSDGTNKNIKIVSALNNAVVMPGGEWFTTDAASIGYKPIKVAPSGANPAQLPAFSVDTAKFGAFTMHLYTNCLKWAASSPANRNLFSALDIVWRFMPSTQTNASAKAVTACGNGPNRVIRFVKMYSESKGMNDKAKVTQSADNANDGLLFHTVIAPSQTKIAITNANKGKGATCLVEVTKAALTAMKDSAASYNIALFLYNVSLLNTDINDPATTYPVGGLNATAKAYGLSSAPAYGRFGVYGGSKGISKDTYGLLTKPQVEILAKKYAAGESQLPITNTDAKPYWRTQYNFILGSVVLITGVPSAKEASADYAYAKTNENILIPTNCPNPSWNTAVLVNKAGIKDSVGGENNLMSGYMVTFKGTGFSSVTSVDKMFQSKKESLNLIVFSTAKSTLTLAAFNTNKEIMGVALKDTNKVSLTLANVKNVKYTAISMFFNSAFTFADSKVTTANGALWGTASYSAAVAMNVYAPKTNNNFYVEGRKFNAAAYFTKATTTWTRNTAVVVYGVTQPTDLSKFYKATPTAATNAFTLNNMIGITTASTVAADFVYATSFTPSSTEANGAWTSTWLMTSYNKIDGSTDNFTLVTEKVGGTQYKDDKAGNVKFTVTNPSTKFPSKIPKWAQLRFDGVGSLLNANSICGITNASGASFPCTNSSGVLTCDVLAASNKFEVCCYAVLMAKTAATYGIKTVSYVLNGITNADAANLIYKLVSSTANNAVGPYTVDNANNAALSTLTATAMTPKYSVLQENAIGKMVFTVALPRDVVRSGSITLKGDFKILVITGYADKIRCVASFSSLAVNTVSTWGTNDAYIKNCDISGIDNSSTGTIVVNTQSFAWKCGVIASKTLYIALSPVQMAKFSTTAYSYTLEMKQGSNNLMSTTKTTTSVKGQTFTITNPSLSALKPVFQADTLCAIAADNVYPRIPNTPVDFTFTFDLTTKKAEMEKIVKGGKVNELAIVFAPVSVFSDWANSMMKEQWCTVASKRVQCAFNQEGILSITIPETAYGTNVNVTVHGVPVGVISVATGKTFKFLCTANNVSTTGTRLNLLTGSGIMNNGSVVEGIQGKSVLANTYNLRNFAQIVSGTSVSGFANSSSDPRTGSTVTMRVGVDQYGAYAAPKEITVTKTPVFHVILPHQYNVNFQYQFMTGSSFKPTMTVKDYAVDAKGVLKGTDVKLKAATFSGRRVTAVVDGDSLKIPAKHRYFEIKVGGLINPSNEGYTGAYDVILTTAKNDFMLRTVTDINTQSTGNALAYNVYPVPTVSTYSKTSPQYSSYRGLNIAATKKWVATVGVKNMMNVNAGRYTEVEVAVAKKASNVAQTAATTTITTADALFKMPAGSSYVLNTIELKKKIMLGTSCTGAIAGMYVVSLASSDSTNFVPFAPVVVMLMTGTTATVTVSTASTNTIKGGSLDVDYTIAATDSNFDKISGTWTGVKDNFDTTASISPMAIAANTLKSKSVFKITDAKKTTAQKFKLVISDNKCFTSSATDLIITPDLAAPTLPDDAAIKKWFVYKDPKAADFALKSTTPPKLNGLLWVVTPTVFPVYSYCALTCKTAAAVSQDALTGQSTTVGYLAQQYTNYYKDATATNMIFSGLVRGQAYKLNCAIQTTQAAVASRTTKLFNQNSYSVTTAGVVKTEDLIPKQVESTQCLEITVTTKVDIPQATKDKIQQYCQDMFSPAQGVNTGCIVCVDINNKPMAPSVLPDPKLTVCAAASARRLRFLTTTPASATKTTPTTTTKTTTTTKVTPAVVVPATKTFSVCAVQSVICNSDLPSPGMSTVLTKMKTNLADKAKVKATINVADVDVSKINIISDSKAPTFTNVDFKATVGTTDVAFSMTNYTNTVTYSCYYKMQQSSTAPTATDIKGCATAMCGKFDSDLKTSEFKVALTAMELFGTKYNTYVVCYNKVPGANKPSAVFVTKSAVEKTCATGTTISANKKTCDASTPAVSPASDKNSMFTVIMSLFAMIMMNVLLFN